MSRNFSTRAHRLLRHYVRFMNSADDGTQFGPLKIKLFTLVDGFSRAEILHDKTTQVELMGFLCQPKFENDDVTASHWCVQHIQWQSPFSSQWIMGPSLFWWLSVGPTGCLCVCVCVCLLVFLFCWCIRRIPHVFLHWFSSLSYLNPSNTLPAEHSTQSPQCLPEKNEKTILINFCTFAKWKVYFGNKFENKLRFIVLLNICYDLPIWNTFIGRSH